MAESRAGGGEFEVIFYTANSRQVWATRKQKERKKKRDWVGVGWTKGGGGSFFCEQFSLEVPLSATLPGCGSAMCVLERTTTALRVEPLEQPVLCTVAY